MQRCCSKGTGNNFFYGDRSGKIPPLSLYRETGWFASNYTVNIFRGCPHACIYCDSRSECYGIDDFSVVRKKENALAVLERELARKKRKGTILTGAMSDPYNVFEREQELTRGFLKLADRYRFGVVVITKSDLVCRDADLFAVIGAHSPAEVNITITAADDAVAKQIEPHAASSSDRFCAIETLSAKGIVCGVILLPVLHLCMRKNISPCHFATASGRTSMTGSTNSFRGFGNGMRERLVISTGAGSPDAGLWDFFVRECGAARRVSYGYPVNAVLA